ncbi:MAG TPA: hypothetical protein VHV08_13190, partial [Pirellulales bacterium]|nr:hypothetical protein [Pirellulales bacterium]
MATILIANERADLRGRLLAPLRAQDHHVLEASSGAEALALARLACPDLIIGDLFMPLSTDRTLVHSIRTDELLRQTLCILCAPDEACSESIARAQAFEIPLVLLESIEPSQLVESVVS